MSELKYLPISFLEHNSFFSLMDEEEKAWLTDLGWDYSAIRQILVSFIRQKLLPGYAATSKKELLGYTYFLVNQAKGIIGAIYAARLGPVQEVVENLISLAISSLTDNPQVKRVEAQIMPFNGVDFTEIFTRHEFHHYSRCYLDLNLNDFRLVGHNPEEKITPWDSARLRLAAEMTSMSYNNQTDALICEDYRTVAGCESYIRSLVENPGCGIFMPEASYMCMDEWQHPCGFIIGCRISNGVGMIPQIAVHPGYQGRGVGNALIQRSFEQYKALGFHTVSLTATMDNRRAFNWYQRLGFKIRKEFGAYVWERKQNCE
jgi:ribosomal protein S18 acetylase RimI-like enzyme